MSSRMHALLNREDCNIDRVEYALKAMCGEYGQDLAQELRRVRADFDPLGFVFDPADLADLPQADLFAGARELCEELTEENTRMLASVLLAKIHGLDPDAPEVPGSAAMTVPQ